MTYYSPPPVVVSPPPSGMATASMVCGILGFITCGLTSLLAVIFGHVGEAQTRDNRMAGRGQAITGLVLGYLVLAPAFFWWILMFLGAAAAPFAGQ